MSSDNKNAFPSCSQRPVRHREAMQREKHGPGICRQVHQEASEHGELSRRAAGGDRARGGHPAADPPRQHRHAARRLREPHRRGADPGAVSGRAAVHMGGVPSRIKAGNYN